MRRTSRSFPWVHMALAPVVAGQSAFAGSGIRARPSRPSTGSSRAWQQTTSARRSCRSTIAPSAMVGPACLSTASGQAE
jgi:hypothetical protein